VIGLILILPLLATPNAVRTQGDGAAARVQFLQRISDAAIERTTHTVRYVSSYVRIPYPGGDVPAETGVCTDEIIRVYRAVRIDLQKEVHEDITANFSEYPNNQKWKQSQPDRNIDHRRVPVLMTFFTRQDAALSISSRAVDYEPGEVVAWELRSGVPHIGIVVDQKDAQSGRNLVMHNIALGPKMEDVHFAWKITGHYRFAGPMPAEKED
jgi:hypothetical protein